MQLFFGKKQFFYRQKHQFVAFAAFAAKTECRSILTEEQKDINKGAVAALEAFRQKNWLI